MRCPDVGKEANTALALVACAATVFAAACEDLAPEPFPQCDDEAAPAEVIGAPTYHQDVAPIINASCAGCHQEAGIAPFAMTHFDEVFPLRELIRFVVVSGQMPPFPPTGCCQDYVESLALSAHEIATLAAWADAGGPEGLPPALPPALPTPDGLERVDVSLTLPEPYEPQTENGGDDWRCFLLEWPEQEPAFITGFALQPSNPAVMHHALVMRIPPDRVTHYANESANTPGAGWPCKGGIPELLDGYLGGWSPGWRAQRMAEGHGHLIEPGWGLVIQTHYTLPARADEVSADQPTIQLMTAPDVDNGIQAVGIYNSSWPLGTMNIPAGEEDVVHAIQYDPTLYTGWGEAVTILSVTLHMHDWGSAGTIGVRRADGTSECLLQIDDYEAEWQGNYTLVDPVELLPGDKLYVECHFDNSANNQPIVLGERQQPRDLNWSEGADGEMCWGNIGVSRPAG